MATTRKPSTPIAKATSAKPKVAREPKTPVAKPDAKPAMTAEERLAARPEYSLAVMVQGVDTPIVTIAKTYRHIANVREVGAHWLENHLLARGASLVIRQDGVTIATAPTLAEFRLATKAPDTRKPEAAAAA